jgi:DNA-binding transcriptional MerR regulator
MKNDIPSKLYYSISEVARITGVKAHVLRYWETEFPTLRVKKSRTGSRRYRRPDIDEVLAIKELLYDQGFKIAGARKVRRQAKQAAHSAEETQAPQMTMGFQKMDSSEQLSFLSDELKHLQKMLKEMKLPAASPDAATAAPIAQKKMKGKA